MTATKVTKYSKEHLEQIKFRTAGGKPVHTVYPWDELEVGDGFFVVYSTPDKTGKKRPIVPKRLKKLGRCHITRAAVNPLTQEKGILVTRTK